MLNTDSILVADIGYLKSQKCNLVVLLSHEGVERDVKLADKFFGDVDVIIGGHSHTTLYKPRIINGVIIVQAGWGGRFLGKLDLKVDTQKDTVISYTDELIETKEDPAINDTKAKEIVDASLVGILATHILTTTPAPNAVAQAKDAIVKLAAERATPPKVKVING